MLMDLVGQHRAACKVTWHGRCRFLESLVGRLSAQLAETQARSRVASPDATGATSYTAPAQQQRPPPWLVDQDTLNPLLVAYDEKCARLEAALAERGTLAEELEQQVVATRAEVDDMRARLADEMQQTRQVRFKSAAL